MTVKNGNRRGGRGDQNPRPVSRFRLVRWWQRRGLRARLNITATTGLAIALAAGAWLGVHAIANSLVTGIDSTAIQGARGVAALSNANRLPDPVPVSGGKVTIQVVGPDGKIIAVSPGADRLVPLLAKRQRVAVRAGHPTSLEGAPYGLPGLLRVVAVPAHGGRLVIAAVSFSQVQGSITTLWRAALIGTPILVVLLAGVNWLVIGGALRPITELRMGAQKISGTRGPGRLPVPQTSDEVHRLAVTLNDMLGRLEAAKERQRAFVSDTAHELRSPLASIRAQLEVAIDHPGRGDWRETARDVLADTLRLARLAEDLLVLAKLDEQAGSGDSAGGVPGGAQGGPADRAADLSGLARDVAARYTAARVPVTVECNGPVTARGEADGLTRVLVNLIDNAVRYARSHVTVAAACEGTQAMLTVTDDGPGIPAADAERVFDRFTRLDDARSRDDESGSGAGLGLAIVRGTVRAQGGAVWLEDAAPGVRAVVQLPASAP
jgi:signal transduction histidine kinase